VVVQGRKIVVLGIADYLDASLTRYKATGVPDPTFSGDGRLIVPIGTEQGQEMSLALQSGRLLVAARIEGSGPADRDFFVERLTRGAPSTPPSAGATATGSSRPTSPAGRTSPGRSRPVGRQDPRGGNGELRLDQPASPDQIPAGRDPGRLVRRRRRQGRDAGPEPVGRPGARDPGRRQDRCGRCGGPGRVQQRHAGPAIPTQRNLDPTFSGDGKLRIDFATYDWAEAVAVQPNGAIVVAGNAYLTGSNTNWALIWLHASGTPDHSFSGDGRLSLSFGTHNDFLSGMVIQASGKIVAVGNSLQGSDFQGALARLGPAGGLDPSFGTIGKVLDDFGSAGSIRGVRNYWGGRLATAVTVRQSASDFDAGAARCLAG
jgi:uncharacterized delta-60 repeat protein